MTDVKSAPAVKTPEEKPERMYPVVAIREGVVFPSTESVLTFGRMKSISAIEESLKTDQSIVFVSQKRENISDPGADDLYAIGTLSTVERTLKTNGEVNALIKGIRRVRLHKVVTGERYISASVFEIPEVIENSAEIEAMRKHITTEFKRAVNLGKPVDFLNFMKLMSGVNPSELADQVASMLDITTKQKQTILETLDLRSRLAKIVDFLSKEIKVLEIERNIASKTQKKFDKGMREAILRERMKTIKRELGDIEDDEDKDIQDLEKAVETSGMPKDVKKKALKELRRMGQTSAANPEYGYIRTWLDTVVEMPWKKRSKMTLSLKKAQKILNEDHYGLKEVKERILEYLAVLKLKSANGSAAEKSPSTPTILCFVGAPGVGKTSIGRSIARALGREFVKVSLGGIRDEAEIRGHRRTYVGAMPGRIIQAVKNIGVRNPVFMLDEIDKIGTDFRGDPSSALLEALDPEQNSEFSDHYLEVPFNLSEVMFITTANVLDTIPPALRDRLEVIEYSGYTEDEKFQIAKKHLLKKVLAANGMSARNIIIPDPIIRKVIRRYTREAGVRSLERELGKVVRKVAKLVAEKKRKKVTVTERVLENFLGPARFSETLAEKKDEVGLATGMAWTPVGGDVLFVEVAIMDGGKKNVILTGNLKKVMQESARAALTYVAANAAKYGISQRKISKSDVHIHVPEGAVPKDGPSAGVTMTTALVSAFTNIPVRRGVSMTGEVTLRGRVLEIGGLKEKVIAAHRAGITDIVLPKSNKKDLRDIPDNVKRDITFHYASTMNDVLKVALARKLS